MESTSSSYHLFPEFVFRKFGYITKVINPTYIKRYREYKTFRGKKTDKADAVLIAEFAFKEVLPQIDKNPFMFEPNKNELRFLVRNWYSHKKFLQIQQSKVFNKSLEIYPYIDEIFNGDPFKTKLGIEFFLIFNDPKEFLKINSEEELANKLKKRVKHFGRGANKVEKLFKYKNWLQSTGYFPNDRSILIFNESLQDLVKMKKNLEKIENLIVNIGSQYEEVQLLKKLPHVSDLSASILVSEIGDIRRFASWQKLYAFLGLDPRNSQSGKLETKGRMSKAGIPYIRALLYTMAMSAISGNGGAYREYFLKRKEEGKHSKIILFSIVQKILRKIYYTLKYKNVLIEEE